VSDVRRAILPLLMLAVFLPSAALAHTSFLCADQLVRESCCCPAKKRAPISVPVMQRECCKLVKHTQVTPPVATVHGDSAVAPVAAPIAVSAVAPPLAVARLAIVPRAQAPPPPTLVSLHCALLV
jgi:hypothetical protein